MQGEIRLPWAQSIYQQKHLKKVKKMGQFLIIALLAIVIFLWLKNKELSKATHTPQSSESQATKTTSQSYSPQLATTQVSSVVPSAAEQQQTAQRNHQQQTQRTQELSLNTGISELDGPGMHHRLNGCGPQGHVCYLLHSSAHNAYKVGICKPERLGIRIKDIRRIVSDARLVGTAVFTSYQNAFDAEQSVIRNNRNYRYRGVSGDHAGGTEWLSRRPAQRRPAFTSPQFVEERFNQQAEAPLPTLNVPDKYTIYLAYSQGKDAYKVKWCRTDNLTQKLRRLQEENPDTKILSRIKIARPEAARAITIGLNTQNNSYIRNGGRDIINWSNNPSYLHSFEGWDEHGNRKI